MNIEPIFSYRPLWVGAVVVVSLAVLDLIPALIVSIGSALVLYYVDQDLVWFQMMYTIRFLQTAIDPEGAPHHTEIRPNIFLGAMPTENWGHLEELKRKGITHVLSFNQEVEFSMLPHLTPITKVDWEKESIFFKAIGQADMGPLDDATFEEAIKIISTAVKGEGKIYIHCLAGRGRSASGLIAYLCLKEGKDVDTVLSELISLRQTVSVNSLQKGAILAFVEKNRNNLSLLSA